MTQVVTQLIVDASGAKQGVAEFEAAMKRAKVAAVDGGAVPTAFERAQARWTQSLGATDPVIKAQIAMERDLARQRAINADAVKLGIATQDAAAKQLDAVRQKHEQYIQTIRGATVAHNDNIKTVGLARHELINLSRQAQDVAVSLGSGQSFGTVLLQQGSQIADVFASSGGTLRGFFGQVAAGFVSILTPARVAVAAIAAVGITVASAANAYQTSQVEVQRALSGTGRAAQLTAADIGSIAEKSSSLSTLSAAEAEKAAATYASTGKIYRDNIATATALTHDFAKSLGVDSADAAKTLAEGLTNGIEGVDKLDQRFGFLTASQREYLKDLDANLDKTKFQAEALRLLGANLVKASELTTSFGSAWNVAGNAVSNFWRAYGSATAIPAAPSADKTAITGRMGALEEDRSRIASIGGASAAKDIAAVDTALANLRLKLSDIEGKEVAAKFGEMGKSAVTLADQFTQAQLKADVLERSLRVLEQAGKMPEVGLTMKPEQQRRLGAATDEARVQVMMARDLADQTERANRVALDLAKTYNTGSIEVARMLDGLNRQLGVAQAVGQMAQIEAQHRARIAELSQRLSETDSKRIADSERAVALAQIESQHKQQMVALQGQLSVAEQSTGIGQINAQYEATVALLTMQIGQVKALEQAEAQRAISVAQANSGADQMLRSLQQQGQLIGASSNAERERIAAEQTYQNLIDKGVDKTKAQSVAQQQLENDRRRREEAERKAAEQAIANIKTQEDAWRAYAAGILTWSVAHDEAVKRANAMAQAAEDEAYWMNKLASSMWNVAQAALLANTAFVPFATTWASMGPTSLGTGDAFQGKQGLSQFDPKGYKSSMPGMASIDIANAERQYGKGNFTSEIYSYGAVSGARITPSPDYIGRQQFGEGNYQIVNGAAQPTEEYSYKLYADRIYAAAGGRANTAANIMIKGGAAGLPQDEFLANASQLVQQIQSGALTYTVALEKFSNMAEIRQSATPLDLLQSMPQQYINRLIGLMDDPDKIKTYQSQIDMLKMTPQNLARDEMIRQLTDSMKNLQDAVDKNTQAQLDPLFSQGHDYLNSLKIGYYHAATGLSGIVQGSGGTDSVPVHMMLTPGEHLQVTPRGMPRAANSNVSNDNSRNVTQHITQTIVLAEPGPVSRLTARQRAQGFITAAARAAG
jgi:hypothetical protein